MTLWLHMDDFHDITAIYSLKLLKLPGHFSCGLRMRLLVSGWTSTGLSAYYSSMQVFYATDLKNANVPPLY